MTEREQALRDALAVAETEAERRKQELARVTTGDGRAQAYAHLSAVVIASGIRQLLD